MRTVVSMSLSATRPWEKIKVEEHSWWGFRFAGVHRGVPKAQGRKKLKELKESHPDLVAAYEEDVRRTKQMRSIIRSGPFPGIGKGDIDLYQAFAWRNWQLMRTTGRMGLVLPRGALSGAGTVIWRKTILSSGGFTDATFLTNSGEWVFQGVDGRYTIALSVIHKAPGIVNAFSGPFFKRADFESGRTQPVTASREELTSWSDTAAFPYLADRDAGDVFRQMRLYPRFDDREGFEFRAVSELHATADQNLFDVNLETAEGTLPVLGGSSINMWSPDARKPYGVAREEDLIRHLYQKARAGTTRPRSAFYEIEIERPDDLPLFRPRIAFKDVTSPTNSRSVIACLVPPMVALVHTAPTLLRRSGDEADEAYLLGFLSSIPFDWYARRWVELHLSFSLLASMPVPRPARTNPVRQRLTELSARLAAVDSRFNDWAQALGVSPGSLQSDPERLEALAEIDALAAVLYGLSEANLEYCLLELSQRMRLSVSSHDCKKHTSVTGGLRNDN